MALEIIYSDMDDPLWKFAMDILLYSAAFRNKENRTILSTYCQNL